MSLLSLDKVSSHPSVQVPGTNEPLPDAARLMAVLDGSGLPVRTLSGTAIQSP